MHDLVEPVISQRVESAHMVGAVLATACCFACSSPDVIILFIPFWKKLIAHIV